MKIKILHLPHNGEGKGKNMIMYIYIFLISIFTLSVNFLGD